MGIIDRIDNITGIWELCCGCEACNSICPQQCIIMKEDKEGFLFPNINEEVCVSCGLCSKVCPVLCYSKKSEHETESYIVKHKIIETRQNSSSGGVFITLAEAVIRKNGVVFGVQIDQNGFVSHAYAESVAEARRFMFSKYVQSAIGNSYIKVRMFLEQDRLVLFSGTSCQIEGLLNFLGQDYINLITVDVVCHGVPSPKVWKKYLEIKGLDYTRGHNICFRKKDKGWRNYSIYIPTLSSGSYVMAKEHDWYLQGFLNNLYLRECCHACQFKSFQRRSDITLSDCWGIRKINIAFDDDQGVSLVILQSNKGCKLLEEVKQEHDIQKISKEQAQVATMALLKSSIKHPKREYFFQNIDIEPLETNIRNCLHVSVKKKMFIKVKKLITRIRVRFK